MSVPSNINLHLDDALRERLAAAVARMQAASPIPLRPGAVAKALLKQALEADERRAGRATSRCR